MAAEGRSEPVDGTGRRPATGRRLSLPGRASEPARAEETIVHFLYNLSFDPKKILGHSLSSSPSRCILRSCVIARTPTLGLGHLRAKRLRRP